jgi:serine/threonine-protein kinase
LNQVNWDRVAEELARLRELPLEERRRAVEDLEPALQALLEPLLAAEAERRGDPVADFLETPFPDAGGDGPPGSPVLPAGMIVAGFRILGPIGQGGMGCVYLAEALEGGGEPVAIKVLAGHAYDARAIHRFELEGQLLAEIRHPNVARWLGSGSLADGRPYVVMEYVDGVAIDEHCERAGLDLRERIRLVLEVCRGVQAVHEHLVVHRDIKPSNVLVDGRGKPRLVDFGIAKPLRRAAAPAQASTATIDVQLTPSFASPEHLLGLPLTVAADVYSLGVLLYRLVTHRMPYALSGAMSREAIEAVFRADPVVPSAWVRRRWRRGWLRDRAFLADVDRVVLAALSPNPADRYATARGLAEDLGRILSGEAVLANRAPKWKRVRSWARRNRVAAAVLVACGCCALVGAVVFQVQASRLRAQAAQARYFIQRAAEIEATRRMLAFMPRDALTVDPRQILVRHAEEIRRELGPTRGMARPAAHYALGRALLSLEKPEKAREQLEAAWAGGLRSPDVALALGEAYGGLYRRALEELRRVEGERPATQRRRTLADELREPALGYLRAAAGAGTGRADYVAGLIAFYEDRLDSASQLATVAYERAPWLHEARTLRADVLLRRSELARERGTGDEHRELLAAARSEYRTVRGIAPSARDAWSGECESWLRQLEEMKARQRITPEETDEAATVCRAAVAVDPRAARARLQLAWLFLTVTANGDSFGEAGREKHVAQALVEARRASELDPSSAHAWHALGVALAEKARGLAVEGGDPRGLFVASDHALARALELSPPSVETLNAHAVTALDEATWRQQTGWEARAALERAITRFGAALEMSPDSARQHGNLGTAELRLALEERSGEGLHLHLDRAIHHFRTAAELDPQSLYWPNNLGNAMVYGAEAAVLEGEDPGAHLDRAEEVYRTLIDREPEYAVALYHLAIVYSRKGEAALRSGRDGSSDIARAREQGALAAGAGLEHFGLSLERALAEWLGARARVDRRLPAHEQLAAAEAHLDRSEELGGSAYGEVAMTRAEVAWLHARTAEPGSPGWRAAMADTERWLAEARRRDPRLATASLLEAERLRRLCEVEARSGCDGAGADWSQRAEELLPGVGHHRWRWR